MKAIDIRDITPGTIAEHDLFSAKGDLLIAKGVTITEAGIQLLERRNIFEVFLGRSVETGAGGRAAQLQPQSLPPAAPETGDETSDLVAMLPDFPTVAPGADGLQELFQDELGLYLDKRVRRGRTADRPIGMALRRRISQIAPGERGERYLQAIIESYGTTLEGVKGFLSRLAHGDRVDAEEIYNAVDPFVETLTTDRNILLNVSNLKHSGSECLFNHALNVSLLSIVMATAMGYSRSQVTEIGMGAVLHDVGMLFVPPGVRHKPGRLTGDEWYEVQKHPILGLHLLEKVRDLPESVSFVAYQEHERENRTGYPKQRSGRLIHRFAKIVQIADVFEAMTSPRNYRKALPLYEGAVRILKMARQGLVPGEFVKGLLEFTSVFPIGSLVELSDGRMGKVVAANSRLYARPVISVLREKDGRWHGTERVYQIDLAQDESLSVERVLSGDSAQRIGLMDGF